MIDDRLAFAPELANQSEGFEPQYFAQLAEHEAASFWFQSRNQIILWALRRYFPDAQQFLEIGCGTGFVLGGVKTELPHLRLYGSEVFTSGLAFAAQRAPEATLFQMDARQIPFQDEFDVVGAFDVLEHIQEDESVLREVHKSLKEGGGVILTVPQHPFLWSPSDDYARHVRRYTASELRMKVRSAGFRILRATSFVSLLLPLMLASRLKQRFEKREFQPDAEFDLSPVMNSVLNKILAAERFLIRSGASFPAGGSLLLIAKKDKPRRLCQSLPRHKISDDH